MYLEQIRCINHKSAPFRSKPSKDDGYHYILMPVNQKRGSNSNYLKQHRQGLVGFDKSVFLQDTLKVSPFDEYLNQGQVFEKAPYMLINGVPSI